MVEPLAIYTLTTTLIVVAGIFLGYWWSEDFTGIMIGIIGATSFNYLLRNAILGLIKAGGG